MGVSLCNRRCVYQGVIARESGRPSNHLRMTRSTGCPACAGHDEAEFVNLPLPPQGGASLALDLPVLGRLAVERAVEGGEDAPLGEIECGRLPVARAREVG